MLGLVGGAPGSWDLLASVLQALAKMQATKTLALLTRALCSACIVYSTAATAALVALHRCFAVLQYLGIQPAAVCAVTHTCACVLYRWRQ